MSSLTPEPIKAVYGMLILKAGSSMALAGGLMWLVHMPIINAFAKALMLLALPILLTGTAVWRVASDAQAVESTKAFLDRLLKFLLGALMGCIGLWILRRDLTTAGFALGAGFQYFNTLLINKFRPGQ